MEDAVRNEKISKPKFYYPPKSNKTMKRKVLRQFIRMSRNLFIGLIVQLTFFCTMIAADLPAQYKTQSIKDIYLTIDFEKESLAGVFKTIEKKTGFSFVYNARTIDLKRELTLHKKNTSLMRILMDVSKESGLKFQRMNNHIHVGVRESNEDVTVEEKIVEQGTTITGRVTSLDDGSTLPGVNVIIKGTAEGTVTDLDGNYSLEVQDGTAVLVFSSVGYLSQEVAVGSQTTINMVLSVDVKSLEEIVVIGYGQQEKINLTGAVGVIAAKELKNRSVGTVLEAMQGQVPGLNIVRTSGQPGNQGIQINIRGQSTFTNNPVLTLVDGIPASLENINPNDIESISVLKDAASAAIYGSRATGGVILVTTKKGRTGSPQLTYNSTFSMQQPTRWPEKPTALDYATIHNQASTNDGTALRFSPADLELYASSEWSDYDWDDYLLNNAFQTNQNISV